MLRALTCILLPFVFFLLSGCSNKVGMFISANINPLKPYEFKLSDGHTSTFYTIQKGDAEETDSLLFFVGGSGHVSHNYYFQSYFEKLPGNITIYTLQKRYVGHRETGIFEPSESFNRYNHYPQLFQDQKEFIQFVLANSGRKAKRIIIFGVSEGGNIAAQLASEIPETTHLLILGSGGMLGIDEFRLWGESHSIDFDQIYQDVNQHPNSIEKKALGHTYKYWNSVLSVNPMVSLKKLEIPILVAIGESDEMVPVASVKFLRNEFKRMGKENLTVKIFPDCDHALNDTTGKNHREELFLSASMWWARL